jgi:5'-nucleotidase
MATGVQTHTRRYVDPINLDPYSVAIDDIAYSLSNIARWTGHADRSPSGHVYSVAQHSVLVALIAPGHAKLAALLHDAPEYLLADLARPIKVNSGLGHIYKEVECRLAGRIETAFGLADGALEHSDVKRADTAMLLVEARHLMGNPDWAQAGMPDWADEEHWRDAVVPWSHVDAEAQFLATYGALIV